MANQSASKGSLSWWQLALLGMGFTTGTGFFLGSGLAIEQSGFSVVLLFLLAAIGVYFVYGALAGMIAQQALEGSFRSYSKKAFGHWAGFSHGWIYWSSEILILGSQLTALGLFVQFWFPNLQLWLLAAVFAVLGVGVVLLGTKGFEETENILAVVKISAILMFIILAFLVFPGILGRHLAHMHLPTKTEHYMSHGFRGLWTGLVFAFFAFAGIEVMGIMATQLKNPKEAPKAGRLMIPVVALLFIVSISLVLLMAPFDDFSAHESPFVTSLKDLGFTVVVHIFNGILILAGFSSLVASLYSVTRMVFMIAKEGDAPKFFGTEGKRKIPYHALFLTIGGMVLSILTALLLPKEVYEYVTTAGGLMLLYTWLMMVLSAWKLLKLSVWGHVKCVIAVVLILAGVTGTLLESSTRPGLYASLALLVIIFSIAFGLRKHWKQEGKTGGGEGLPSGSDSSEEEPPIGMWMPRKGRREKART
ncbi:amino acid permease [Gorillibacterium sp. sgz5001074]|uniref:amino acid permease n=1 Tax=Gorillibacterium sp. sgz5001074 TaxID=3446695 RepID=UPI003F66A50F